MTLKIWLRRIFSLVFLPFAALREHFFPGIRILMYHRVERLPAYDQLTVNPEHFAAQMAYLSKYCRVITLYQAVKELQCGGYRQSGVVITFDDGYRDNLIHALPILKRYCLPATIFVTVGFCDQTRQHPRYPISSSRLHLDWKEVRSLADKFNITIGSHSLTHPYLPRLSYAEAQHEITASRRQIAAEINRSVDFFCYPSGDLNQRETELVRDAGYLGAVTVAPGYNRSGISLYELRRTEVTDNDHIIDFFAKLHGAYDFLHAILHWCRRHRSAVATRALPADSG